MNVPLQMAFANEFFWAGKRILQKPALSQEEIEQARGYLTHAKETLQLCLDEGAPESTEVFRGSIEKKILEIREIFVGQELPNLD